MKAATTRNTKLNPGVQRLLGSRWVTSLTTPHGVDRYLELFNPTWSVKEVRAVITAVRHETEDSVTLTLNPYANWKGFIPGQFVRLTVEIDGVRRMRCYSPANSLHRADGQIELTAKAHATGFVSRHLHNNATVGTVVTLSQADGEFALPAQRPDRILLISGGSGITPVMSMLRTLCDEGHAGRITFLHYANRAQDVIYASELSEIAARYPNVQLLRAYMEEGGELKGLFSREQLAKAVPDYADAQAFLCGPPGMMKVVQQVWAEEGLNDRLHLEHFTAAPMAAPVTSGKIEGEVRFIRSERYATNTGGTLLDQAEAAGLRPEAGCRMGICKACTCKKTTGQVRDIRSGELSAVGEEEIQICVSVPVGTVTLDI